jgi:hypothetical protein
MQTSDQKQRRARGHEHLGQLVLTILKAIRERLSTKGYDRLRAQLEKKGWIKSGGAQFPGSVTC